MSKVNVHSEIGSRFGFKDRQPRLCQSNLIYKYTCESCKAFYIGKTERQFGLRICEHQNISARTGKEFKSKSTSDIFHHSKTCKSKVNPDNFTVVDSHRSGNGLLLLESLHQKTKKPTIGIMQQSTPLLSFD